MSDHRPIHRLVAWLAMLMLVLNALTPLAAQAAMRAVVKQGETVEICTSTGLVRLSLDPPRTSSTPRAVPHCPFCLPHDGQASLPPVPASSHPVLRQAAMPPAFHQAASTSSVWLAALSRGPPSLLR